MVDAKDSGRLHVPARLSVALSSVEVEGKSYDIETNTIGKSGENQISIQIRRRTSFGQSLIRYLQETTL